MYMMVCIYFKNGQQNPDRPKLQDATPPTHSSRPPLDTMSILSSSFIAFALQKPCLIKLPPLFREFFTEGDALLGG